MDTKNKRQQVLTRIPLLKHHVIVPCDPLDVVPPRWAGYLDIHNFGGPYRAKVLQKIIDDNQKQTTPDNSYMSCSCVMNDGGAATTIVTGFAGDDKDLGFWVLSNFEGVTSNKPMSEMTVRNPDQGQKEIGVDAKIEHISNCYKAVSQPIIAPDGSGHAMHLSCLLGAKKRRVMSLIESLPEDVARNAISIGRSMMPAVGEFSDEEILRHEIGKAVSQAMIQLIFAIGPGSLASVHHVLVGFVIVTNEATRQSRSKDYGVTSSLCAFPVFNAVIIKRCEEFFDNMAEENGGDEFEISVNSVAGILGKKSHDIAIQVEKNKVPDEKDLSMTSFFGAVSHRYLCCSDHAVCPPPFEWCLFNGFIVWKSLAMVFGKSKEAFDPWVINVSLEENREFLSGESDTRYIPIKEEDLEGTGSFAGSLKAVKEGRGNLGDLAKINERFLDKIRGMDIPAEDKEKLLEVFEKTLKVVEFIRNSIFRRIKAIADGDGTVLSVTDLASRNEFAKRFFKEVHAQFETIGMNCGSVELKKNAVTNLQDVVEKIADCALKAVSPKEFLDILEKFMPELVADYKSAGF